MGKRRKKQKKNKKRKTIYKPNRHAQIKLICPECHKDKKIKNYHDGYIICAWCGLVVEKNNLSFEEIETPGFIIKGSNLPSNKNNNSNKEDKHHDLKAMQKFIKTYTYKGQKKRSKKKRGHTKKIKK